MAHLVGGQVSAAEQLVLQCLVETLALCLGNQESRDGLGHDTVYADAVHVDVDGLLLRVVLQCVEAVQVEVVVQSGR